jgi:hypothetical protein
MDLRSRSGSSDALVRTLGARNDIVMRGQHGLAWLGNSGDRRDNIDTNRAKHNDHRWFSFG